MLSGLHLANENKEVHDCFLNEGGKAKGSRKKSSSSSGPTTKWRGVGGKGQTTKEKELF